MEMIGFDSDEVKNAVMLEYDANSQEIERRTKRLQMFEQHAVCYVCEAPLYPSDADHHVSTGPVSAEMRHYCSAHCPACNQADPQEDDDDE